MQLCHMSKLLFIHKFFMHHQKVKHYINMKMSQKMRKCHLPNMKKSVSHSLEFSLKLNLPNLASVGEHVPYSFNSIFTKTTCNYRTFVLDFLVACFSAKNSNATLMFGIEYNTWVHSWDNW